MVRIPVGGIRLLQTGGAVEGITSEWAGRVLATIYLVWLEPLSWNRGVERANRRMCLGGLASLENLRRFWSADHLHGQERGKCGA